MIAEIIGWDIFILAAVLILGILPLVISIWAIVDIAQRSDSEFQAIGQTKTTWLLLVVLLTFLCGLPGAIIAVVYLLAIRPKFVRA